MSIFGSPTAFFVKMTHLGGFAWLPLCGKTPTRPDRGPGNEDDEHRLSHPFPGRDAARQCCFAEPGPHQSQRPVFGTVPGHRRRADFQMSVRRTPDVGIHRKAEGVTACIILRAKCSKAHPDNRHERPSLFDFVSLGVTTAPSTIRFNQRSLPEAVGRPGCHAAA